MVLHFTPDDYRFLAHALDITVRHYLTDATYCRHRIGSSTSDWAAFARESESKATLAQTWADAFKEMLCATQPLTAPDANGNVEPATCATSIVPGMPG